MPPMVLVTRPEPQASLWAAQLRNAGLSAQALPLMATQAAADPGAVRDLWHQLRAQAPGRTPSWRALMFVSPAAVHWFFRQRPADAPQAPWPVATWLACPGLGTAQALRDALREAWPEALGDAAPTVLHPPADAPQFDSEHLWPVLQPLDWSRQRVAIVSGGDADQAQGRRWLTERWQAAGAEVHTVLTYQRGPSVWSPAQSALAEQAWAQPQDHLWLVSSSDALQLLHTHHLPALLAAPAPEPATPLHRILTTHPRIAERAASWGWREVLCCAPTQDAIVTMVRSVTSR